MAASPPQCGVDYVIALSVGPGGNAGRLTNNSTATLTLTFTSTASIAPVTLRAGSLNAAGATNDVAWNPANGVSYSFGNGEIISAAPISGLSWVTTVVVPAGAYIYFYAHAVNCQGSAPQPTVTVSVGTCFQPYTFACWT